MSTNVIESRLSYTLKNYVRIKMICRGEVEYRSRHQSDFCKLFNKILAQKNADNGKNARVKGKGSKEARILTQIVVYWET